ncbi:MAG: hypothetical protein R2807_03190 [Chitinophagales bacterium]
MEKLSERKWLVVVILILIGLFLYFPTIQYDYALDDYFINTELPQKEQGIEGLFSVFKTRFNNSDYRPILTLSYAIENYFSGSPNPAVSHGVNIVLYLLLCISIYFLLRQLPLGEHRNIFALAITLLFLTHPIHTNVVCNLKSRDNILSMLFGILSCWVIFQSFNKKKSTSILLYLLASLFFILAILSKYDAVSIVLFLPFLILLFYGKERWKHAAFIFILFFFLQVFFYSILPNLLIASPINEKAITYVTYTENPFFDVGNLFSKIAMAAVTFFYYLKFLLVPYGYWYYFGYDQVALYPFFSWQTVLCVGLGIVFLVCSIYAWKKDKLLALGLISTLIFLVYCLNFIVPVAGIIADRYAFMASLGFCITIIAILYKITPKNTTLFFLSTIVIASIWFAFSYQRSKVWKDSITLIENDIPHLEKSYEAQRIAAMTYMEKYDKTIDRNYLQLALKHIQKANKIYPSNSVCHIFEGIIYYKMGNTQNALHQYKIAQQNDTINTEATELIADLYYEQKKMEDAVVLYQSIYNKDTTNNGVINKISTIIYETVGADSVLKYNNNLIQTQQHLFAPYENLGYLFLLKNDTILAKKYFNDAVLKGMNPQGVPTFIQ